MNNEIANEEKSDFICLSHLDAQGQLRIHDICNSFDQVEYETFVFPIDSMHK